MAKIIILDSENPTYNKAEHPEDIGHKVSISLADGFSGGSVSGLEAGDNIDFEDGHLVRTWRDGVENILTVEHGLRTINITDYFGGETPYSAITLNDVALPNQLAVKIENDIVFTEPYSCDPNFNEIITGVGYVTNLGEGDKISCESSPEYFFSSEGLEVLDDENDIVIADNTTGQTDKVYYGANPDDISEKTLTVADKTLFNGSILGYLNYNIEGTDDDDILIGGAGADTISAGAGDDYIESGDGNDLIYSGTGNDVIDAGVGVDTIYTEGTGLKTVTGGNGNNTFVCGAASTTITDSKAGDVVAIEILTQDAGNFYGFTFVRGDGTPESTSTDLTITYHDDRHLGDDKIIVLENYFKKVGDDYVMNDNAVTDFRLIGSNYTKDYVLEWKQSPADGEYHMYNIVTEGDAQHIFRGAMSMRNWIVGSGEADILIGDETDDVLLGGAGNDTINGGYGNDYIDGGEGYNIFEFEQNLLAPDSHITINNSHLGDLIRFNWNVPEFKATYDAENNKAIFTFYAMEQGEEIDYRIIDVNDFNYYNGTDVASNINNIDIFNGAGYSPYFILGNVKFDRIIDDSYDGIYFKNTPYMENLIITSTRPVTVVGLIEGDNIVFESVEGASTSYTLDENGMKVVYKNPTLLGSQRTVIIEDFDYTTDPVNVLIGNEADTNRSLEVSGYSLFDATQMTAEFESYNITGTNNDDILTGGAGADTITTGTGNDTVNAGAGADTIYIDGIGTKTVTGGDGNNTFVVSQGTAIITDSKAGDVIAIEAIHQGTDDFVHFTFERGEGDSTSLFVIYNDPEHLGDSKTIEIQNYFKKVGDDYVMNDNAVTTFRLIGYNSYEDHELAWKQSPVDGSYDMYKVLIGNDEPNEFYGAMHIKNWIEGKGEADMLHGASSDDVLIGGAGNDLINGSKGNDYMDGGEGYNVFAYDMNLLTPGLSDIINNPHLGDLIRFNWNVPRIKATYDFDNEQAVFTFYANIQDEEVDYRTIYVKGFNYYDTEHKNIDNIEIFNGADYSPYFILGNIKFDRIIDNSYGGTYIKTTPYMENLIITATNPVTIYNLQPTDNIVFESVDGAATSYTLDENGMNVVYQNPTLLGSQRTVTIAGFDYENDPLNVLIGNEEDTNRDKLVITNYSDFHADHMKAAFTSYDITTNNHDSYIYTGAGNDTITSGAGDDFIESGAGDDIINTGAGVDCVNSGEGDDVINTGEGNDIIILDGAGTKIITGGAGENKFHLKNGSAAITDAKAGDMIEFATFATGNIEFTKGKGAGAQDLIISSTFEGNEDSVVIKNYFNIDGSVADNHINTFIIDGSKYTFEWLQDVNGEYHMYNVIEGTDEPDNLQSIAGIRNWIKGKGADDTILGSSEEDVLVGNTGNDTITGGEGTDTFVFNPGDGNDTITDAHAGDIIEFGKGSADFSKDMFERSAIEGHTDDLIITYSKVTPANPDTITLENYFSEAAGLRLSTYVTSDGVTHEFIASDEQISSEDIQDNSGKVNINKDTTGEIKVDASGYVSPSAKGIVVNNKSANAALDLAGSFYNDTINTSKSTGNNTVVESYGTNTIKTGKGNDYVVAENYSSNTINVGDGNNVVILDSVGTNKVTAGSGNDMVSVTNYSSNTINVGAGNNEVILDGAGTNKVTAGNDNNTIAVNTGINTIKLGKGNNTISFAGGINTVTTGAGDNVVTIGDGINKVTTGKGDDEINIHDGNNTINSGASKTQVENVGGLYVGGDQYYINGGYNTIKSTGSTYVNIIDSSTNTITTGGKDDIFEIDGGVNNIKGGAGADKYTFKSLNNDNKTVITDSKGNDVYDFTTVNSFDGIVAINDKNGVDTIKLADNSLKLFFDGTFNKKTCEFKFGKDAAFVTEVTTEVTSGIQVTGKTVDKLNIECADNSLYDVDGLRNAVATWFAANDGYSSVSDVFDSEDQQLIDSLLSVYNDFNNPPAV